MRSVGAIVIGLAHTERNIFSVEPIDSLLYKLDSIADEIGFLAFFVCRPNDACCNRSLPGAGWRLKHDPLVTFPDRLADFLDCIGLIWAKFMLHGYLFLPDMHPGR
jgi:hypothetical protein